MQTDALNQARNIKVYDDTQKTLQASDNFKNWKINKQNELFNTALTNRANTYNLNSTYDYYAIDPTTGGPIYYKNGKALQKAPVTDQTSLKKAYFDNAAEYAKNIGRTPSEKELEGYFKYIGGINNTPDISNAQLEQQKRGMTSYVQPQMRTGKEIKRMIVPFYTGKMGA
jgi:hypothetical protein